MKDNSSNAMNIHRKLHGYVNLEKNIHNYMYVELLC